jgi:hypothetical protein
MTEVVIHRCTLRLVRRGGWSWGPEPRRLVQGVVRALPALLARELAGLWPDGADGEITTPFRVAVPVRLEELMGPSEAPARDSAAAGGASFASLGQRLGQALRVRLAQEDNAFPVSRPADAEPPAVEPSLSSVPDPGGAPARLLLAWHERGELDAILEHFSLPTLEAWRHAFFRGMRMGPLGREAAEPEAIGRLLNELPPAAGGRAALLRRRLTAAVAVMHQLGVAPHDPVLVAALDRTFPLHGAVAEAPGPARVVDDFDPSPAGAAKPPTTSPPPARATSRGDEGLPADAAPAGGAVPWHQPVRAADVPVASALPFLLLVPLSRAGYLKALAAALEAAERAPDLPLFAAALAYKVLTPPERGWRRRPADGAAAAAFAASASAIPEPALVELARQAPAFVSVVDAVLRQALLQGHDPGQPLLLHPADNGLLLVDVEGLCPVAWAAGLDELSPVPSSGRPLLLIDRAAADPVLLHQLDSRGCRFVTDAPPTRRERWRPLRQPPAGRWWTNDRQSPAAVLARHARRLAGAAEKTDALWRTLRVERPAVPLAADAALERSLTLAAAAALGTIAWTLWREREPVDPLLALERFGDLDAHVRFDPHRVRVRLPLGRRYQDLWQHGLLVEVADVPWLGGRVLQFAGG